MPDAEEPDPPTLSRRALLVRLAIGVVIAGMTVVAVHVALLALSNLPG